jgi:MiaB-like tRNA modifying enzyme
MRVAFEAYGCTLSYGESRRARRLAEAAGIATTDDASVAPVVVMHTCTVIGRTERHMLRRAREVASTGRRVVLAGCLPRAQGDLAAELAREGILVVDGEAPEDVVAALAGLSDGAPADAAGLPPLASHAGSLPDPTRRTDAIVPIASGCLGACSYCLTRFAWGALRSVPLQAVVDEARGWLAEGFREVQLTAQDTGVWGRDLEDGGRLPDLVRAVASIDAAPADYRVRVGMLNPDSLADVLGDLARAMLLPRVYRFAHVPVQSGSDRVLGLMRRDCTASEYERLVAALRGAVPGITVHTDVICGFPTESEEDFESTLGLMRRVRPDVTNVKAFSARPGTEAASMEGKVHGRVAKERTRRAAALAGELTHGSLKALVGGEADALVTELGKGRTLMGRDIRYRPVVMPGGAGSPLVGQVARVRLAGARGVYLLGELI